MQDHTIPPHASQLPFAFSVCLPNHFLPLISLISVHFQSINSFVFHSYPPLSFVMIIKQAQALCHSCFSLLLPSLYRKLKNSTSLCINCSLRFPSPRKHHLIPLLFFFIFLISSAFLLLLSLTLFILYFIATKALISPRITSSRLRLSLSSPLSPLIWLLLHSRII